jgi:hypothetical protein
VKKKDYSYSLVCKAHHSINTGMTKRNEPYTVKPISRKEATEQGKEIQRGLDPGVSRARHSQSALVFL